MLLCDDEPSPESSDEVFFFCEEQTNNINNKCDDPKDSKDNNKIINNKSYSKSSSIDQSVTKADNNQVVIINNKQKGRKNPHLFNRRRSNSKKSPDNIQDSSKADYSLTNKISAVNPDDEVNKNFTEFNQSTSTSTSTTDLANASTTQNEATQTSQPVLVKIQVENCSQCPDNSISFISHEASPVAGKDNLCKIKKKTVAVQVNLNSMVGNSVGESHCLKVTKVRCCNKATQRVQSLNWGNKCNDIPDNDINSWSGKNMKNQSTNAGTGVITGDNKVKLHDKSNSVDRASIKSKKFSNAVSPLKQFNRSSLTIGPDKITVNQNLNCYNNIRPIPSYSNNLSKYSPCASRLAASSKILGNTSPTALSPESPLHGAKPKSPRFGDSLTDSNSSKSRLDTGDKATLQASLSFNINQLKKPHSTTPRSRSVGDSCVTSPTSEVTTLRYSPTGTEILSLDKIRQQQNQQQIHKYHHYRSNSVSLSAPDLKALHTDRLSMPIHIRKANLETKC